ncbi:MAG: class I SAM-dependent methyltransferase [Pseudonocardiaceae bacterium]|nr:class I SAM-dependent methyltransferase [Pseudonocardiaceae bacterium]
MSGDATGPTPPVIDTRRALSFGARAELYDRVRPTYPSRVLPLLFADLRAEHGRYRVADVGAGTGKLTAVLAAAGLDVDAIEPDPGMRVMLTARLPRVRVHAGRGEALPLADGSVDAVVYGQAWHWVDGVASAQEAARVLRPEGVLAMLWNSEDDTEGWVRELGRLVRSSRSQDLPGPPALQRFGAAQVAQLPWLREQDVTALPDYALSHSAVAILPIEQREAVLAAVRRLTTEHPDLRGRDRVTVPMHLEYWRYRREAYG